MPHGHTLLYIYRYIHTYCTGISSLSFFPTKTPRVIHTNTQLTCPSKRDLHPSRPEDNLIGEKKKKKKFLPFFDSFCHPVPFPLCRCVVLHFVSFRFVAFRFISFRFVSLHFVSLHFISFRCVPPVYRVPPTNQQHSCPSPSNLQSPRNLQSPAAPTKKKVVEKKKKTLLRPCWLDHVHVHVRVCPLTPLLPLNEH